MLNTKARFITKSEPIIIPETTYIKPTISSPTSIQTQATQYELNTGFFDPMKSSPPNEFLTKLKLRMIRHDM